MEPSHRLVTLAVAAEYFGVHVKTLRRRIDDGTLTAYRFGSRMIRVDLNEIDAALAPVTTEAPRTSDVTITDAAPAPAGKPSPVKPSTVETGTAVELDNGLVVFKDRTGYVLGSADVGKQKPIPFGWRRIVRTFVPVEVSA